MPLNGAELLQNTALGSQKYKQAIRDTGTGTVYVGFADFGSSLSAAVWQIHRIVTAGGDTDITAADGDLEFNNVMADYLTLTYS